MRDNRQMIAEVIQGWERLRNSSSRVGVPKYKLGNHLAQEPLCREYLNEGCKGCPVMRATSRAMCHHTPFDNARRTIVDWAQYRAKKNYYLVDKQIEFMKQLDELELMRRATEERMKNGPVLASDLKKLLDMGASKLSWWMKSLGCHAILVREGSKKTLFYELPHHPVGKSPPGYSCDICEFHVAARRDPLMPFSLKCPCGRGQLSLVAIDKSIPVTHYVSQDTVEKLS